MTESGAATGLVRSAAGGAAGVQTATARLNFNVSQKVFDDVQCMAEELHMTKTQLFRLAFSILRLAIEAKRKNHKLVIADRDNTPVQEILIPE